MVATLVAEEFQFAVVVMLWVLPSLKVPMAANDWNVFMAIEGFDGVIDNATRFARVTDSCVLPLTEPRAVVKVAVIVVVPTALPVAKPLPVVIEAILAGEEVHETVLVMSWVVPSEKLPLAVNCCWVFTLMDGLAGVTAIETSVAFVTIKVADPETPLRVALMDAEPAAIALARPATPFVLTVAMLVAEDFHVTCAVRSFVLPSLYLACALNWAVVPGAIVVEAGDTAMVERVTGGGVPPPPPPPLPPDPPLLELPPPHASKYRLTPVRSTEASNFLILPPTWERNVRVGRRLVYATKVQLFTVLS
jgi:hypothetical protein